MTKGQLIEKVEIAHNMYEIIKEVPVTERHFVFQMLEQYQRADWDKHKKETFGECANKAIHSEPVQSVY